MSGSIDLWISANINELFITLPASQAVLATPKGGIYVINVSYMNEISLLCHAYSAQLTGAYKTPTYTNTIYTHSFINDNLII